MSATHSQLMLAFQLDNICIVHGDFKKCRYLIHAETQIFCVKKSYVFPTFSFIKSFAWQYYQQLKKMFSHSAHSFSIDELLQYTFITFLYMYIEIRERYKY